MCNLCCDEEKDKARNDAETSDSTGYRSVELTGELPSREALMAALFENENDPRSNSYKRTLVRPNISLKGILLRGVLPTLFAILTAFLLVFVGLPVPISVAVPSAILIFYIVLSLKKLCIWLVKVYQRLAPASIRNKCRFEPSCSQYMILSIEKHGVFRGVAKGIDRLRRCNTKDGGYDYP